MPTAKNVPQHIWQSYTQDQKQQCLDLRAKVKAGKKRKAAAVNAETDSSEEEDHAAGAQMLRKKK